LINRAMTLDEKFRALETGNAPGQEIRQEIGDLDGVMRGKKFEGVPVDFSHGDVDAFLPTPGASDSWQKGFMQGGQQAYTEYRGAAHIREGLADRLGKFTGRPVFAESELILTPGTQGSLFLALGATVTTGTKVAVVEPDYFANHRIEAAFKNGTKVFVFSTPNNPTGLVFSKRSITTISSLASAYDVTLIVDQLYSRMLYSGEEYTHLRACEIQPENLITIMGPSKTESLSGFRLGAAFGTSKIIDRMERLQAIVSLRAAGYNQAVLDTWFQEPSGWMEKRVREHEAIRDELLGVFRAAGFLVATPQAGSYLFTQLPPLDVDLHTFVRLLRHQASVTVTPGTEFAPACTDSIRLNFSQDHDTAVAAVERIVKMVDLYRSKV